MAKPSPQRLVPSGGLWLPPAGLETPELLHLPPDPDHLSEIPELSGVLVVARRGAARGQRAPRER